MGEKITNKYNPTNILKLYHNNMHYEATDSLAG